jgi:hypothetical protein
MNKPVGFRFFLIIVVLTSIVFGVSGESRRAIDGSPPPLSTVEIQPTAEPAIDPGGGRRGARRLSLAGLGLMMSVLGAVWGGRHRLRRRHRRYQTRWKRMAACGSSCLAQGRGRSGASGRFRVRRFDYDRFYLRMLRDL